MERFVFISDPDLIEILRRKKEFRNNALKVSKDNCFKRDGYLVYEPWLDECIDPKERNMYDTGDPDISYDDLCNYQSEFEEKHGGCDGFALDAEVIAYQLELTQYCMDRARNII